MSDNLTRELLELALKLNVLLLSKALFQSGRGFSGQGGCRAFGSGCQYGLFIVATVVFSCMCISCFLPFIFPFFKMVLLL